MINFNGTIELSTNNLLCNNRAFLYGDGIFETVRIIDSKVLFLEDHYFRLMSGMRIIRMEIPMNFTMEYFEEQLLQTAKANAISDSCKVRITVFRNKGGLYLPETNSISFLINATEIIEKKYVVAKNEYEVDLYKDFYVSKQLLSSIKSTNRMINITGSIFANENDLQNCILINESKNVVEVLNGNLFMFIENKLITPPVSEGCLNGVMRKQILSIAKQFETIEVIEEPISPFDLQKADELFITNVIIGIQPITKYRKKDYGSELANKLLIKLNEFIKN
jgi:branched-chain amino acid aminotransferase